jgi:geranylgeranyl pyrophosphate synthase
MTERYRVDTALLKILEENGGETAAEARAALLKDPALKGLEEPLTWLSTNWRDPLTPGIVQLSCEAVGGSSEKAASVALAICLMHQSFYIWDDIIDNSMLKMFKPTLFGKFGGNTSLIIGGLSAAKAFSVLNQIDIDKEKMAEINGLCWKLWANMAQTESVTLERISKGTFSCEDKFLKIEAEASDLEICAQIGAVLGDGSPEKIRHLAKYGFCLGVILELWKDLHVAANLTLGLAEKLKSGVLPYATLWASQHSEKLRLRLENAKKTGNHDAPTVTEVVEDTLATGVLDNVVAQIEKNAVVARKKIACLAENRATRILKSFVDNQPNLFLESLK